jgi:hypothetical protein
MIGKDKSCHAASEETIAGNLFGAGACRSLEFAISGNPLQGAGSIMHPGRNRRQRNYQQAGDRLRA